MGLEHVSLHVELGSFVLDGEDLLVSLVFEFFVLFFKDLDFVLEVFFGLVQYLERNLLLLHQKMDDVVDDFVSIFDFVLFFLQEIMVLFSNENHHLVVVFLKIFLLLMMKL